MPNSITGLKTNTSNQDRAYTYDDNGNMTKNGNKSITWTSFNKPKKFTKGGDSTTITYDPNRSRYQKEQTKNTTQKAFKNVFNVSISKPKRILCQLMRTSLDSSFFVAPLVFSNVLLTENNLPKL
jgi:uncharacterized protein YcnI